MSRQATFMQECPICGRPLEIRKEYRGKKVACPQCGGRFVAVDAASAPVDAWNQNNDLIHRADQLLEHCTAGGYAIN